MIGKKSLLICSCEEAKDHCKMTCEKWEGKRLPDITMLNPFWQKHKNLDRTICRSYSE